MTVSMLTTVDNPYDPFDQWDEWYQWDDSHGYATPGLLARITVLSTELSEADQAFAIEKAIDEIVRLNPTGMHTKVTRESDDASAVP